MDSADFAKFLGVLQDISKQCAAILSMHERDTKWLAVKPDDMKIPENVLQLGLDANRLLHTFFSCLIDIEKDLQLRMPEFGSTNNHLAQTIEYCLEKIQEQKAFCRSEVFETQNFYLQMTSLFPPIKIEECVKKVTKQRQFKDHHVEQWNNIIDTYEWKFKLNLKEVDSRAAMMAKMLVRNTKNLHHTESSDAANSYFQ